MGLVYKSNKDYDDALLFYTKALDSYMETGYILGQAQVKNNLGVLKRINGKFDQSIECYDAALLLRENYSQETKPCLHEGHWEVAFTKKLKKFSPESPETSKETKPVLCETWENNKAIVELYSNMAFCYSAYQKDQFDRSQATNPCPKEAVAQSKTFHLKALDFHCKALKKKEDMFNITSLTFDEVCTYFKVRMVSKVGNETPVGCYSGISEEERNEFAFIYRTIARCYKNDGEEKNALEYFKKSLAITEITEGADKFPITALLNMDIAEAHYDLKDFEEAAKFYKKACNKAFALLRAEAHEDEADQ